VNGPPAARLSLNDDGAKHTAPVPRRALRWPTEVAAALGLSDDFLRDHGLAAELPMVRVGSLRLVPVAALDAWLADRAGLPLDDRSLPGNRTCSGSRSPAVADDPRPSEARVKSGRAS
jgi:excisionase family DNA binding protein